MTQNTAGLKFKESVKISVILSVASHCFNFSEALVLFLLHRDHLYTHSVFSNILLSFPNLFFLFNHT